MRLSCFTAMGIKLVSIFVLSSICILTNAVEAPSNVEVTVNENDISISWSRVSHTTTMSDGSLGYLSSYLISLTQTDGDAYYFKGAGNPPTGNTVTTQFLGVDDGIYLLKVGANYRSSDDEEFTEVYYYDHADLIVGSTNIVDLPKPIPPFSYPSVDPGNFNATDPEYMGELRGSHRVGVDGSFNYGVDIQVPPGINGMEPGLSFVYNSNSPNGYLGWGWQLSGIDPAITRCGKDYARDGERSGTNSQDDYRFCLGSERLVEVSSGEYRTESDTFKRITTSGGTSKVPTLWTVEKKNGRKVNYGLATQNAYALDNVSKRMAWYPHAIYDTNGNSISIFYEKPRQGVLRLDRIEYTKNNLSQDLDNKIEFTYEARADLIESYRAGTRQVIDERLSEVTVYANGAFVRKYSLGYQELNGTTYADPALSSRLEKITECASSNKCKQPITFDWTQISSSDLAADMSLPDFSLADYEDIASEYYTTFPRYVAEPGYPILRLFSVRGDFDGDNLKEIAYWDCDDGVPGSCSHYAVMSKNESPTLITTSKRVGTFTWAEKNCDTAPNYSGSQPDKYSGAVMDVNGDGLDDYYVTSGFEAEGIKFYLSNGNGFTYSSAYSIAASELRQFHSLRDEHKKCDVEKYYHFYYTFKDINGDGLIDVLKAPYVNDNTDLLVTLQKAGETGIYVSLNNGAGFGNFTRWGTMTNYQTSMKAPFSVTSPPENAPVRLNRDLVSVPSLGDVNGDGRLDIIGYLPGFGLEVGINTGSAFSYQNNWASWSSLPYPPVDQDRGGYECLEENGHDPTYPPINYNFVGDLFKYADINGDGLTDILILQEDGLYASLSNGKNYTTPELWSGYLNWDLVLCGTHALDFWNSTTPASFGLPRIWGRHYWKVADYNQDGKADVAINIVRDGHPDDGSPIDYERFKILVSRGYELRENNEGGLSQPIEIYVTETDKAVKQLGVELTSLELNERGEPVLRTGYKDDRDVHTYSYDDNFDEIHDWGAYKIGLKKHRIEKISVGNGYDKNLEVEYKNINRNAGVYAQSAEGYENIASILTSNHITIDGGEYGENGAAHRRSIDATLTAYANNLDVVSKVIQNGRVQKELSYNYKNYKSHPQGFGSLGFEKIYSNEKKVNFNRYIRNVDEFYQEVSNNNSYALMSLKRKTSCIVDEEFSMQGCPESDFENIYSEASLISDIQYSWLVKLFNDDIDDYESPHFYPYIFKSTQKDLELNQSSSGPYRTVYTRLNDDNNTSECPFFVDTSKEWRTYNSGFHIDEYGTPYDVRVNYCDGFGVVANHEVNSNIVNDTANWCLGLVGDKYVNSSIYDFDLAASPTLSRHTNYTFNNCKLDTETREPNTSDNKIWLKIDYDYDNYGYRNQIVESVRNFTNDGISYTSRTTGIDTQFNYAGLKTVSIVNPLNHSTTEVYENKFGKTKSVTDPNGLISNYYYDEFGRIESKTELGLASTISYHRCSECFGYDENTRWYSVSKTQGKSHVVNYYDGLDRETGTQTRGLSGELKHTGKKYNAEGLLSTYTQPQQGDHWSILGNSIEYDVLGRKTEVRFANGGVETTAYGVIDDAVAISKADSLGNITEIRFDSLSREKTITDANAGLVQYWYNAQGAIGNIWVSDEYGQYSIKHQILYDQLGRKTALIDPDTGRIDYTYNALGHLATQRNDEDEYICYQYDKLDRPVNRKDRKTTTSTCGGNTHYWHYDAAGELGLLDRVSGVDTSGRANIEDYSYNDRLLPEGKTVTVDGRIFELIIHYDTYNRERGISFPTGFTVENVYNNSGYLAEVHDAHLGFPIWQAANDDAYGNLEEVYYGNGVSVLSEFDSKTGLIDSRTADLNGQVIQNQSYQFDTEGNLKRRWDTRPGISISQGFCYDRLHRLVKITTNTACNYSYDSGVVKDFLYDVHGNVQRNSWAANLNYYDENNNLTHGVRSSSRGTYEYDNAGRIINGPGYTIDYSLFGKPTYMGYNSGAQTSIVYGALQKRIQRTDVDNGELTKTYYLDKYYELIEKGSKIEHRHYLGDWGVHLIEEDTGKEYDVFLTRDHNGSIATKTDSFDSNSPIIKYHAHEPWGKRQDKSWAGATYERITETGYYSNGSFYANTSKLDEVAFATTRGFTDHEHLDGVGLIHMNGRIYDPVLTRFISPDPWIQDPTNSQSFNRYSYVWNNPLRYTDPTGELTEGMRWHYQIMPMLVEGAERVGAVASTASNIGGNALADATPIVGDIKGIYEAVKDPSVINITAATVGLFPLAGDAIAATLKTGKNISNATETIIKSDALEATTKNADNVKNLSTRTPESGDVIKGEDTVSIFKAPQPGKGADQYRYGYDPKDFCEGDQCAYFAKNKSLADDFARHYGEGVIELKIPKDVYDSRLKQHEYLYQDGPLIELPVPHSEFDVLNSAERILHK